MGIFCTIDSEKKRIAKAAKSIVEELSNDKDLQEHAGDLGLGTEDAKEAASEVIADMLDSKVSEVESGDKRDSLINKTELFVKDFINRLTREISTETEDILEGGEQLNSFEHAQKCYDKAISTLRDWGFGRIAKLEFDEKKDFEEWWNFFTALGSVVDVIPDYGNELVFTVIVRKPVESKMESEQAKTVRALENLSKLRGKKKGFEIVNRETGETKWVKSNRELTALNKDIEDPNERWEKTGRADYDYFGKSLRAIAVTSAVNEGIYKGPVLSGKLGGYVDKVGRVAMDPDSFIWKNGKLVEDELLTSFIQTELDGVFSLEGLKNLINDFENLREYIIGENGLVPGGKIFTGDLSLFAQKKGEDEYMVGKPDLIVIDKEGELVIFDFKTKIMSNSEDYIKDLSESSESYRRQLFAYVNMLKAYGFKVKGNPYLVRIDTFYDTRDKGEYNTEPSQSIYGFPKGDVVILGRDEKGELDETQYKSLSAYAEENQFTRSEVLSRAPEEEILYMEPRLHVRFENGEFKEDELNALSEAKVENHTREIQTFEEQFNALSADEQEIYRGFAGPVMHKSLAKPIARMRETDINSKYSPLSAQETRFLAENLMYRVSDQLERMSKEQGKSHIEVLEDLGNGNVQLGVDLLIHSIFEANISGEYREAFPIMTKEEYEQQADEDGYLEIENDDDYIYYFDDWENYLFQQKMNDKRKWLMDHYNQFISLGTAKLGSLEDTLTPMLRYDNTADNHAPDITNNDNPTEDSGDNDANEEFIDRLLSGLSEKQAWMMGQKQYSPKASLSKEIKHMLEHIIMKNKEGKTITDPYGWGMPMYLDSTSAVQTILDTCANCDTYEEMEDQLKILGKTSSYNWVNQVLKKLKDGTTDNEIEKDNLKKKFFSNFRKDRFLYVVNKYRNENGERFVQPTVINLKTANQTMRDALGVDFAGGKVGKIINDSRLVSRGPNNKELVASEIQIEASNLFKDLKAYYNNIPRGERQKKVEFVEGFYEKLDVYNRLTDLLNSIGINVPVDVVEMACSVGIMGRTQNNALKLLGLIQEAMKTLKKTADDKENQGMIPNSLSQPVFRQYAQIIDILSSFVQEHVESMSYHDGKTYYSYSNPSALGYTIRNLQDALGDEKKFNAYMEKNFGRFRGWYTDSNGEYLTDWLKKLSKNDNDAREALQHRVELSFLGKHYRDLGPLGFQLSILANYWGTKADQNEDKKGEYRLFALPTMSNKPTNEFIRFLKYGDTHIERNDGKIISSNDDILDNVLFPTFLQEMNRMADVLWHYVNSDAAVDKLDLTDKKVYNMFELEARQAVENSGVEYKDKDAFEDAVKEETESLMHSFGERIKAAQMTLEDLIRLQEVESGAKFHFLWYLNAIAAENQNYGKEADTKGIGDRIVEQLNIRLLPRDRQEEKDVAETTRTYNVVKTAIGEEMSNIVERELDRMKDIGLFERQNVTRNGKTISILRYQDMFGGHLGNSTDEKAEQRFEDGLVDFIWQDIAANINIIQITGGDLAYYGNAVNYQKRIAQEHSPGIHCMSDPTTDDGYFRSIHVSDIEDLVSELAHSAELALNEYKETIQNDNAKQEYEEVIKYVTAELGKIECPTDGQSLNSPTSIKKKMNTLGQWTQEKEDAYQKILAGDFSMTNLMILSQPTKPFLNSKQAKYSGSPTMMLRKVPLQDKNSEYLILLADALVRGANKRSKITAIYDFMEETARLNPKRGIDTVHMASVAKVGLMTSSASGKAAINLAEFDASYDEKYQKAIEDGIIDEKVSKDDAYSKLLTNFLLDKIKPATNGNQEIRNGLNKNPGSPMEDAELFYNTDYVETVPIEDYIIQQEVPAHLIGDDDQLYGSQIRILGISDITPSTKDRPTVFKVKTMDDDGHLVDMDMSAEDLIEEYKNLHADNIESSKKSLMHKLGLDTIVDEFGVVKDFNELEPQERNTFIRKLQAIIERELRKDSKYNEDLIRDCQLVEDEDGNLDFAVPLYDPIQSKRIQQLINSIIKKGINKQRISGGPVVQATAYDNRLHVRFQDDKGNLLQTKDEFAKERGLEGEKDHVIVSRYKQYLKDNQASIAYYECYMSVPDESLEALITRPDGTRMSFEEARDKFPPDVWDSLTRCIGYRIPTEDKYSMVPIKIVGFLPKGSGEVVMMPQEITTLTGSDFDIDKMYIFKKAFSKNIIREGKNGISYKKLEDYRGELQGEQRDLAKQVMENGNRMLSGEVGVHLMNGIEEEDQKKIKQFADWYEEQLFKHGFTEYAYDKEEQNPKEDFFYTEEAKLARDNRLFELQWAVLTGKDTVVKMLNPGNFEPQKKIGRVISVIKNTDEEASLENWKELSKKSNKELDAMLETGDGHNTTLPSSKIYFQRQNMQGSQMVGIFANNNVSHAFMTFQQVGIDLGKLKFIFDDVMIGDPQNPTILDRQRGFNGQLISKTIASFLAASVDTAKDPTLSSMNINTFTGQIAMVLARLGFDTEAIGLFLSQPIIVELSDLYFKRSNEGTYTAANAIHELREMKGIESDDWKNRKLIQNEGTLTKENMIAHLRDSGKDSEEREFQTAVLQAFDTLSTMAKDIKDLTFCTKFNSVTNAAGPTIADTVEDYNRVEDFFKRVGDGRSIFYVPTGIKEGETRDGRGFTDPAAVIENDPILNAFYTSTIARGGVAMAVFKNLFPNFYTGFEVALSTLKEDYLNGKKLSAKLYNKFLDDYIYFMLTYASQDGEFKPTLPSGEEDMKYLIEEMPNRFKDIQARRKVALEKHLKDPKNNLKPMPNALLDSSLGGSCLRIKEANQYVAKDTLEFNGSKLKSDQQDKIADAWNDIIQQDDPALDTETNNAIHRFGVDLFFYSLMRNGFTFSPKTLMHLASYMTRVNATYDNKYNNYIQGLTKLREVDNTLSLGALDSGGFIDMYCRQFFRNHSNNPELVPTINTEASFIQTARGSLMEEGATMDIYGKTYQLRPIQMGNEPAQFLSVIAKGKDNRKHRLLFELSYADINESKGTASLTYKRVSPLGLANEFVEYSANEDREESFFKDFKGEMADLEEEELESDVEDKQQDADEGVHGEEPGTTTSPVAYILRNIFESGALSKGSKSEKKMAQTMARLYGNEEVPSVQDSLKTLLESSEKSDWADAVGKILKSEEFNNLDEVKKIKEKEGMCNSL